MQYRWQDGDMTVSVLARKDYDSNGRAVMTRHRGGDIDRKDEERCTEHFDQTSSWPSWELCKQRRSGRQYDYRLQWKS